MRSSALSTAHIERVPGGGASCRSPVSPCRYVCVYQQLAETSRPCSSVVISCGSSTQPGGTVWGLISVWQTRLVLAAASTACCATNQSSPASEIPSRVYSS